MASSSVVNCQPVCLPALVTAISRLVTSGSAHHTPAARLKVSWRPSARVTTATVAETGLSDRCQALRQPTPNGERVVSWLL